MKPYTIIALVLLALLSLIPPIDLIVANPPTDKWFWMVLIAAFFGMYTCFMKTSIFIKIIAVGAFINSFFSVAPYLSFTSYVLIIISCYFFIVASRIEDWSIIFKGVLCLLIINCILIAMQLIGHDTLLNWDTGRLGQVSIDSVRIGVIGQHMQMGSFSVILSCLLMQLSPWFLIFPFVVAFICHSVWSLASIGACAIILLSFKSLRLTAAFMAVFGALFLFLAIKEGKISQAFAHSGRIPVFQDTIRFANQRPFFGWGLGSYKSVFPALNQPKVGQPGHTIYKTAHCDFLQVLFEIGYPGFIFCLVMTSTLAFMLWVMGKHRCLAAFGMILTNMLGHFPMREIQCVPLILLFLAYCQKEIYGCNSHKISLS